jgi:hypothetical protein
MSKFYMAHEEGQGNAKRMHPNAAFHFGQPVRLFLPQMDTSTCVRETPPKTRS